jgi:hypothetical protein
MQCHPRFYAGDYVTKEVAMPVAPQHPHCWLVCFSQSAHLSAEGRVWCVTSWHLC